MDGFNGNGEPVIRFRNYVPRDENLQELKVAPPQALKFEDPVANVPDDTNAVEGLKCLQCVMESGEKNARDNIVDQDPIVSIAPKKANWDLRRDVAKKLTKLERRTQRALVQLMQEEEKRRQAASPEAEEAQD